MAAQDATPLRLFQSLVKVIAAVAGAVVGVGTLAFSAGFLAQRAQYDFMQVPFVFIDYWAYAETGLMALVRSINLFVSRPLCLAAIGIASVAVVLAMESEGFRQRVMRAHWSFVGYLLLILWLCLLLRQELVVRELRNGPLPGKESRGAGVAQTTTVPVRFPFAAGVPKPLAPPPADRIRFPDSSFAVWSQIADDLESETPEGAIYLDVRPRPSWAIVARANGGAVATSNPVLGVPVDPERLDSARAEELYRLILSAFVIATWAFGILALWQRRVHQAMSDNRKLDSAKASRAQRVLERLREELWFSSKWILQGIAGVLLITTGIFLIPECYGLLALPRLGQEYVEVISASDEATKSSADGKRTAGSLDVDTMVRKAMWLLNRLTSSSNPEGVTKEWRQLVASLEEDGSENAAEVLRTMADASGATAADLSDMSNEALSRVASRTYGSAEGFILYYPRSETEYLRILQRNPISRAKRWTIHPVKMADIVEIRVKRAERTIQLIRILRRLPDLAAERREGALADAEKLGHGRLLETAIGGSYDPSHQIRGFSITDIGRYAAGLSASESEGPRGDLAIRRLLEFLQDPEQRDDNRGAAVTALQLFVQSGEPRVCTTLVKLLEAPARGLQDELWQVRGTAITAAGRLRCRAAVPRLLALLKDATVPVFVRATIPTSLGRVGTQDNTAPQLGALMLDPQTPIAIVGTALSTVPVLAGRDTTAAVDALVRFLQAGTYGGELQRTGQVSEYRQMAIDSLRRLGNPRCIKALRPLIDRRNEPDAAVRARAVLALGEFEDQASEGALMDVAETADEDEDVRTNAIDAEAEFFDDDIVRRLVALHPKVSPRLRLAIVETLRARAQGSTYAEREESGLPTGSSLAATETALAAAKENEPTIDEPTSDAGDRAGREPRSTAIEVGSELRARLDDGDRSMDDGSLVELVEFEGRAGQKVTVDVISNDFDAMLSVTGPGMEPKIDDDSGGGCNPRIEVTLPRTARYTALVTSAGEGRKTGDFVVRVSDAPPPPIPGGCEQDPAARSTIGS